MTITSSIKLTQGSNTDLAGRAVFGTLTDGVVAFQNADNTGVGCWLWTMIDVPPGSAIPIGFVSNAASGAFAQPDVRGGYLLELTVGDGSSIGTSTVTATSQVTLQVKEASGRYIPPFKGTDASMAFGGQKRGWAPAMEAWLHYLDGLQSGVKTVFGRAGDVVSTVGDYTSSQINNASAVTGVTVTNALNNLQTAINSRVDGVSSVFGRTGVVIAVLNDYTSSLVQNTSTVTGSTVTAALNFLNSLLASLIGVTSVATVTARNALTGQRVGAVVYVESTSLYYSLEPDLTTWKQISANPVLFTQTAWYVSDAAGSDDNSGKTSGTALKTSEELCRRLGAGGRYLPVQDTDIYFAAGAGSTPVNYGELYLNGYSDHLVVIHCEILSSTAITLSAVVNTNAAVARGQLTTTGATGFIAGARITSTSGAQVGAVTYSTGQNANSKNHFVKEWFNYENNPFTFAPVTVAPGTTCRVDTLLVSFARVDLTFNSPENGYLELRDADFTHPASGTTTSFGGAVNFVGCQYTGAGGQEGDVYGYSAWWNCAFFDEVWFGNYQSLTGCIVQPGCTTRAYPFTELAFFAGNCVNGGHVLSLEPDGHTWIEGDFEFCNGTAGTAIAVTLGSSIVHRSGKVWSLGTPYDVGVSMGSLCRITSPNNTSFSIQATVQVQMTGHNLNYTDIPRAYDRADCVWAIDPDPSATIGVTSVFGRGGAVVAVLNDYTSSLIQNLSVVTGSTVTLALNNLQTQITSSVTGVSSVFGRTGTVVAVLNDYTSSLVQNTSTVVGATVTDALNALKAALPTAGPVSSVFGRVGAVVAVLNDYTSSLVQNTSTVTGSTVTAALDTLKAALPTAGPVSSVFGRVGAVVAVLNDYTSSLVQNLSSVTGGGSTVTTALNALQTQIAASVSGVSSVFGRSGVVVAVLNDYTSSLIQNTSTVAGATVTNALDALKAALPTAGAVSSVFGRTGAVVAVLNDYTSSLVQNVSTVTGSTVTVALDTLKAALPTAGPIVSVFGRTGVIIAVLNDYTSSLVQNLSTVTGSTVTLALNSLQTQISNLGSSSVINQSSVGGSTVTLALNNLLTALPIVAAAPPLAVSHFATTYTLGVNTTGAITDDVLGFDGTQWLHRSNVASRVTNDSARTPGASVALALDAVMKLYPNGISKIAPAGSYTLDMVQFGYLIELSASGTFTFTIPTAASSGTPIGASFDIMQRSPGSRLAVAVASGVVILNNVQLTADPFTVYRFTQVDTDVWTVIANPRDGVDLINGFSVPIIPLLGTAGWGGGVTDNYRGTNIGGSLGVAIPLFSGVSLTAVNVLIEPATGHGALPTGMPFVQLWADSPFAHSAAGLAGSTIDSTASVTAYELAHTIAVTPGTPLTVANSRSTWLRISDESGGRPGLILKAVTAFYVRV